MTKLRMFAVLVVVAHWVDAVGHLFLAAKVLPPPNDHVSWLAITLISSGHVAVCLALWTLRGRFAGLVSLIFFLAAMGADLYEHFLHASGNNVFMIAPGDWTASFNASVFALLGLEILGCVLGVVLVGKASSGSHPQIANHSALS